MKGCTLSEDALLKVLLHAAKHPTTAVNGVLLGTVSWRGVRWCCNADGTSPRAAACTHFPLHLSAS